MGDYRIQADYDMLGGYKRTFEQAADHTAAVCFQMHQCIQHLQGGDWTGFGAQSFYNEMAELVLPALERLESALQTAADGTARIIETFQSAEEEAKTYFAALLEAVLVGGGVGGLEDEGSGGGGNPDLPAAANNPVGFRPGIWEDPGGGGDPLPPPEPPPPATPEQIDALADKGIVLAPGETISQHEAAWLLNYIGNNTILLRGGPWSAADLREAITILRELDALNINVGTSNFIPEGWSLAELRQIDRVVDTMADHACDEFRERYTDEQLIQLAAYYGLPAEQARFAPLLLTLEDRDITVRRDNNDNVNYVDRPVQYYPEGTIDPTGRDVSGEPVVYYSYLGTDGNYSTHDIRQSLPEGATQWAESYWYARAGDGGVTFGDRAFFEGTQNSRRGSFTSDSLIAHEIVHIVVARTPGLATDFANLGGAGEGGINLTTSDSSGYIYNPRSSNRGDEPVTDLITNGLLGGFPDTNAGRVRAAQFDEIIGTVFEDNYPEGANTIRVDPRYEAAAREALGLPENPGR